MSNRAPAAVPVPSLGPWEQVGDRTWRAVAQPEAVTIGLVAGSEGALVIDTGSSPAQGEQIRRSAEEVAGVPVVTVALTHAHYDHVGGLGAFADLPIHAHLDLARHLADPALAADLAPYGVDPADLPRPDRTFGVVRAVSLGDRVVELISVGAAHTDHDVIAVVADVKCIFAGDVVEPAGPEFGPDADPERWPASLDNLIGLMLRPGWTALPGHGEAMTMSEITLQRGWIASILGEVTNLVSDGVRYEDAEQRGDWPFPWERIAPGVRTAYDRLAERGFAPRDQLPIIRKDLRQD
ncbi:Glyoxylase, beta-lactamase superfamily II [Raineyella antarctica]|uniref:Glyoxylase, beta-lactamase superfamily II n=1 Tax=Raineyella antarctica TaxID=1577474 RepID=A0A1G6GXU1_9ACTN|nr:MBL fold metallo-hydrolase [Raineyella antarctica]SDB86761.1 Glyoxylase, beta-lactamase superfamily II [Raineyella antarctica]